LPPLPALRGPARAILLLVRPRRLFLHWFFDETLREAMTRRQGPAEIRLEASADGVSFREVARHEFDPAAPGWYLPNDRVDTQVRARIGLRDGAGFRELLVSNALRVPRESPGTAEPAAAGRPVPAARPRATSPGGRPDWHGATSGPAPAAETGGAAVGLLGLVLHAHLPFVRHPEREYFLEEHWLFEAITETYLPLLDAFDSLLRDGVPARVTMSLTPTLMAMLRDPVLVGKYARHLDRMCDLARREVERTRRDPDFGPVTGFYRDRLEWLRFLFVKRYASDLVGQFARLEREGILEIIACAATHGFLPHLAPAPGAVRAQIAVGVAEHRRQIGRAPRGIWLPECAYYEGLDENLARAGVEYFFVDSHAVRNATGAPRLGLHAPLVTPAGVAAFARDEESSVQVWSSEMGYPGDPSYRDFYRDIGFDLEADLIAPYLDPAGVRGMTGFKYHRITGRTDHKEPYRRAGALRAVLRHARDFVSNRQAQIIHLRTGMDRPPMVVAMYDAELFGHWWFEGPEWLEAVLRALPAAGIRATSPGLYLDGQPPGQIAEPSASSWGEGGYYDVWLNPANDWIQAPLHDAGRRMAALAARPGAPGPLERRALQQAGRELLLAQASDWPFILRNQTTVSYARRRIHEHLDRFDRLARQIEEGRPDEPYLARVEALDNPFPDLDPGVWRSA
jgi:1,4-alpha-glucan branching enzyme